VVSAVAGKVEMALAPLNMPVEMHYNDPDADMTIVSNDGTEFKIHHCVAMRSSKLLGDMFSDRPSCRDSPIKLDEINTKMLDLVLQCMYQQTRPERLGPRVLEDEDVLPFLAACMFMGVQSGIQEANARLNDVFRSRDLGLKVYYLGQLEKYPVRDETRRFQSALLRSVLHRASRAAYVETAMQLPLSHATSLQQNIPDQAIRWNFIQMWLEHQREHNSLDEDAITAMLIGETIPDDYIICMLQLSVRYTDITHRLLSPLSLTIYMR